MTETRQEFLARVAQEHEGWVREHLDTAPFNPASRPDSPDYNVWNVDMDSDGDAQAAFMQSVGEVPTDLVDDLPEFDSSADTMAEEVDDADGQGGSAPASTGDDDGG